MTVAVGGFNKIISRNNNNLDTENMKKVLIEKNA